MSVDIDTNVNTLMPQRNKRISLIREEIGIESERSNYFFLSISDENLFNLKVLGTFQDTIDRIMEMPEFEGVLSPFNFIFFNAEGTRIIPGTLSETGRAPTTAAELAEFEKRIKNQSLSENFVAADNGRILTALFTTGRIEEDTAGFMNRLLENIAPLEEITRVYYSGDIPFQDRVAFHLSKDFSTLLVLALAAMLIIFLLSFRTVRAMILPMVVVIIGAIWTMGFMSILGFEITIVSVIIPSLILTIGSSYTIHILSEYYRNPRAEGTQKHQWLADAVEHVIKTVVVAALTTMISFLSLLTTTLEPLQEFGLSIGLGIFFCAILALIFLPAMFAILPTPRKHLKERMHRGPLTRVVTTLGSWSARHPFLIAGLFVLLFAGFLSVYPHIKHQSDYFSYFPANDRIIKDTQFINEHSGGSQTFNITLTAIDSQEGFFLTPQALRVVDEFESLLEAHSSVTNKLSFLGILKNMNKAVAGVEAVPESRGLILLLNRYFRMIPTGKIALGQDSSIISEDGNSLTIYLKMSEAETFSIMNEDDLRAFLAYVEDGLEKTIGSTSIDSYLWGSTMLLLDTSKTIKHDQLLSTFFSMILGMIISAIFFKSFTFSIIALIPLLSGIFWYFITLFVSGIPLDMTTIIVTNVTVGVGLDDAVHFILQYRMQRRRQPYKPALSWTLRITGRPIVLTTLSMVAGLMVLCFASFKPVVYLGYLVAGTLFSTMVGTIMFIPAAITIYEKVSAKKALRRKRLT